MFYSFFKVQFPFSGIQQGYHKHSTISNKIVLLAIDSFVVYPDLDKHAGQQNPRIYESEP